MALAIYERFAGISGTLGYGKESYSAGYVVSGTTDSAIVVSLALDYTPPVVLGTSQLLVRQPMKLTDKGQGTWHVDVDYTAEDEDKNDDDKATPLAFKISWDTSGGTQKITQSLGVPFTAGFDAFADFVRNGVIGYDGKKVNGCDITIPSLALTIDIFYPPALITINAVKGWARATGKTNANDWLGFEAGECLLVGCTGEQTFSMLNGQATKPVPVSFKVHCSENIPAPFVVDAALGLVFQVGKKGWQNLDVYYIEKIIGTPPNAISTAVPWRAKIHTVYPEVSFQSIMGIG